MNNDVELTIKELEHLQFLLRRGGFIAEYNRRFGYTQTDELDKKLTQLITNKFLQNK